MLIRVPGSAYFFEKDDSTGVWNEKAKLTASDGVGSDQFGRCVSVSGNIAIVGAPWDDDKGKSSGSAYIFEKDDSTGVWNEKTKLTASDEDTFTNFGWGVSFSGNVAIVGKPYDEDKGYDSGSAYIFERDEST